MNENETSTEATPVTVNMYPSVKEQVATTALVSLVSIAIPVAAMAAFAVLRASGGPCCIATAALTHDRPSALAMAELRSAKARVAVARLGSGTSTLAG